MFSNKLIWISALICFIGSCENVSTHGVLVDSNFDGILEPLHSKPHSRVPNGLLEPVRPSPREPTYKSDRKSYPVPYSPSSSDTYSVTSLFEDDRRDGHYEHFDQNTYVPSRPSRPQGNGPRTPSGPRDPNSPRAGKQHLHGSRFGNPNPNNQAEAISRVVTQTDARNGSNDASQYNKQFEFASPDTSISKAVSRSTAQVGQASQTNLVTDFELASDKKAGNTSISRKVNDTITRNGSAIADAIASSYAYSFKPTVLPVLPPLPASPPQPSGGSPPPPPPPAPPSPASPPGTRRLGYRMRNPYGY